MTKKNMENGEGEKKRLNSGNMVKVRKVLGEGEDRPCSSGFWEILRVGDMSWYRQKFFLQQLWISYFVMTNRSLQN